MWKSSEKCLARKSIIGLEERNGGFMYGKMNEVRDGAITAAILTWICSLH